VIRRRTPHLRSRRVNAVLRVVASFAFLPVLALADASTHPAPPGVDEAAIDTTVSACTNFYRHACGGFLKTAPVSERTPRRGLFEARFDNNLQHALDRLFDSDANDAELVRLATFHRSCRAAQRETTPADDAYLARWFARIDSARDRTAIELLARQLDAIGVEPFFSYDAAPDPADWTRWRGELGAPILYAKAVTVAPALEISGLAPAHARDAAAVIEAMALRLRAARDGAGERPVETLSWQQLESRAPGFDWAGYHTQFGAPSTRPIGVPNVDYVVEAARVLRDAPLADLRAYLRWRLLLSLRGELPPKYAPALSTLPPSLRGTVGDVDGRCRDATVRAMGVEFSRQFSKRIVGTDARNEAHEIAERMRRTAIGAVQRADWLSDDARRAMLDKLARLDLHIGFPDRWPATGRYALTSSFLENVEAARRFEQQQKWKRTQERRDRASWQEKVYPWVGDGMASARLVLPNGFPDAYSNSLVMTAAMLMPPQFATDAPEEFNYGTFGTVVAHELVHVLELHMFGTDGRPAELWSADDTQRHDARMKCVVSQATAFVPGPGLHNPGDRQADENVADLAGVRLAYEALAAGPRETTRRESQTFFYAYAQRQCLAQTPAELARSIDDDSHGPAEYRVNGPLANLPAFAEAFRCPSDAPMASPEAALCRVW
jgi:putative endopeptidase